MKKHFTFTGKEETYKSLEAKVGKGNVSSTIESLVEDFLLEEDLETRILLRESEIAKLSAELNAWKRILVRKDAQKAADLAERQRIAELGNELVELTSWINNFAESHRGVYNEVGKRLLREFKPQRFLPSANIVHARRFKEALQDSIGKIEEEKVEE